jgi:hypothetical protein
VASGCKVQRQAQHNSACVDGAERVGNVGIRVFGGVFEVFLALTNSPHYTCKAQKSGRCGSVGGWGVDWQQQQ